LQLRAVLIKDLISPNDNQEEIDLLKKKIKLAERQRLSIFLDSVRQTNEILGRWASQTERLDYEDFDHMFFDDYNSFY
jgi:hypothetical protein